MNFITNHDENSWNGTIDERLGESWRAMAVLSYALRGLPLIYGGQEVGLNHRLSFFGKDEIDWKGKDAKDYFGFYQSLNRIKSDKAMATNSAMFFPPALQVENTITVDRGENAEYRIVVNVVSTPNASYPKSALEGYGVDLSDKYDAATGVLDAWGYIVLKKK